MTLTNVETGLALSAQYNPEELDEQLEADYKRLAVQGLSHEPLQYIQTKNLKIEMELGFDETSTDLIAVSIPAQPQLGAHNPQPEKYGAQTTPAYMRRFLQSFMYARKEGGDGILGAGTPRALFTWPGLFSVESKITKLSFKHKRFNLALKNVIFTVKVSLEESRMTRIYSEDLLARGTERSA